MFAVFSIAAACLFAPLTSAFQHCCFQLLRLPVGEKLTISTSINSTEIFYWVLKWTPASTFMTFPDPLTPQSPRPFEFSIKRMPQRLWNHVQSHKLASLMVPAAFPSIFNRLTGLESNCRRLQTPSNATVTLKANANTQTVMVSCSYAHAHCQFSFTLFTLFTLFSVFQMPFCGARSLTSRLALCNRFAACELENTSKDVWKVCDGSLCSPLQIA